MIRDFQGQDREEIMRIWLDTNISAHHFIAREYWNSNYDAVKAMLPSATIYVYAENNVIQGFVGLMGENIAGIFVSHPYQSHGIGKKLLEYAKEKKDTLSLQVYQENARAVRFYLREGFHVSTEQVDENTGKREYRMTWAK